MAYQAGDVVQTTHGVGVIVLAGTAASTKADATQQQQQQQAEEKGSKDESTTASAFKVLLSRVPGKSISSGTVTSLPQDAIVGKLPAAPGMITEMESPAVDGAEAKKTSVLVLSYSPKQDTFTVVPMDKIKETAELQRDDEEKKEQQQQQKASPGDDDDDAPEEKAEKKRDPTNKLAKRFSQISQSGYAMLTPAVAATFAPSTEGDGTRGANKAAIEVASSQIQPAPSAKFYPLLLELMNRGDEAATVTSTFVQDKKPEMEELVEKTTQIVQDGAEKAKERLSPQKKVAAAKTTEDPGESSDDKPLLDREAIVDGVETTVKDHIPKEEEVQQLLTMLKDEELTVLLQKGKERLEQLVSRDIPEATHKALEKSGIRIAGTEHDDGDDDDEDEFFDADEGSMRSVKSSYRSAMIESQKAALSAMEQLLQQANIDGIENVEDAKQMADSLRAQLGSNFATMFDSLAKAAKSDRNLSSIFETISGKTAEWQEATGRLMSTKSASLFLEGASRIQARAANIFSKNQINIAGEIGSKFTKAFTEGDAAVARLKSIELGDSVRNRLVAAIEVRSESLGGLDGIIAGALTSLKAGAKKGPSNDQMSEMLTVLQTKASTFSKDANETLISVLAKKSEFRDVALLKVEQVVCDLNVHFGEEMSAEDIAAVARGEGGTAKLFEPVAKRAAKEIEKQLDVAETSVTDQTMLDVLKRVRRIVSGELTVTAVMDEVVNILNDEKVVAAGENVLAASENVLDAIEGVSGNKVVDDVMRVAHKAGITKDSVMQGIEKINVNELLDTAGNAMTDETARKALLSDATDTALDFVLRILPSMPVPPFDGVRDGLVYHVSNLSMEGFKVKKETIFVEVAGMHATKKKDHKRPQPSDGEEQTPAGTAAVAVAAGTTEGDGMDATSTDAAASTASAHTQTEHPPILRTESTESTMLEIEPGWLNREKTVKASELLIIEVEEVSAEFNDAMWSFEQTYLPYLKGDGKVDVKMFNGGIRLAFELRRRLKAGEEKAEEFDASQWEPVLCLHDRKCSIGAVELTMQGGGRLAWVVNKLAAIFKGPLRDYVVRTILNILSDKSGWILSKLNQGLSPYWDVIMRTAKLELDVLEEATSEDIVAAKPVDNSNFVELVWRDPIPLGMNLLLNDESGQLKVVDFPRGSQARAVCERKNLDPVGFEGAAIIGVNGIRHSSDEDLYEALRDPGRPKTIMFELADSDDAERVKRFVEQSMKKEGSADDHDADADAAAEDTPRTFQSKSVTFEDSIELGIEFAPSQDKVCLVIKSFLEGPDGVVLAAQRNDKIQIGDLLTHVNDQLVIGDDGKGQEQALKLLEEVGGQRPLKLTLAEPYLRREIFERPEALPFAIGGPSEFVLEEHKPTDGGPKRIIVKDFKTVDGVAENFGVLLGDHLVFINGVSVGAGCRWIGERIVPSLDEVINMMASKDSYPIGLTFARPKHQSQQRMASYFISSPKQDDAFVMNNAETICVTAEKYEQLGCILENKNNTTDVIVTDFQAVPGPFQAQMKPHRDSSTRKFHLSIESINGQFVPGYATSQIVRNAMQRSWKSDNRVEVLFCDDERKEWVRSLQ